MASREGFQTAGAVAGFVAFVGMVAMYFMNQVTFGELVEKDNAAHKAINPAVADITVDYGPGNIFDSFIDALWGPWGIVIILVPVLIWLVIKVKKLSQP